jgi:hypothetical protein
VISTNSQVIFANSQVISTNSQVISTKYSSDFYKKKKYTNEKISITQRQVSSKTQVITVF